MLTQDPSIDQSVQDFWTVCVENYQNTKHLRKIIRCAERHICQQRENLNFLEKGNLRALDKWKRYGHEEQIFRQFPQFANFLFDSNLISQIKVTRDSLYMISDEPHLLVESEWIKWDKVLEDFTFKTSKRYKEVFVVRQSDSEVFTYLDNGKGLQLHHPYQSKN